MADVAFVATIVVFFALAALFVRACDHIIGADDDIEAETPEAHEPEQIAA